MIAAPLVFVLIAVAVTVVVCFAGAALSHADRKFRSEVAPGSRRLAMYDARLDARSRRP